MDSTIGAHVYNHQQVGSLLDLQLLVDNLHFVGDGPLPRKGYYTFFDPGLSLVQLHDQSVVRRRKLLHSEDWYGGYDWANHKETPQYRQLRVPVPESFDLTYKEQVKLLREDEVVASTRSVAMLSIIHQLHTGRSLLPQKWVHSIDESPLGGCVLLGYFGPAGLRIEYDGPNVSSNGVGLASERKL